MNQSKKLLDGIINVNSERGLVFDLTSDKFEPDTYLWKDGQDIYISFIATQHPGCGDFKCLVERIQAAGYRVKLPMPMRRLKQILVKNGWEETAERFHDIETDVWIAPDMNETLRAAIPPLAASGLLGAWSKTPPSKPGQYDLSDDDGWSGTRVEVYRRGNRLLLKQPRTGQEISVRGLQSWSWRNAPND